MSMPTALEPSTPAQALDADPRGPYSAFPRPFQPTHKQLHPPTIQDTNLYLLSMGCVKSGRCTPETLLQEPRKLKTLSG
ncbi:hypothetical protein FA13DRAFT_1724139 [Coprinellus micaceus]|uniref:Uncharacterized protein n=1 Tax=Coprinellus micaceus TaxID=71717 RepID=A0A4Y7U0H2_COPMI|nr:hypothetical protein FA13DRAFT_1724139 [Coprinellus micaceus]